jgi:hypothetical protein
LHSYAWVFDKDVTRINELLTLAKQPPVAQLAMRMKDDLRAAKEKIEAIAASLDK